MADLLDIRQAAALAGRDPETLRRWARAGRLQASRRGNRLFVDRSDVEALAGRRSARSLAEWATKASEARRGKRGSGVSAADLVIEDRAQRS